MMFVFVFTATDINKRAEADHFWAEKMISGAHLGP